MKTSHPPLSLPSAAFLAALSLAWSPGAASAATVIDWLAFTPGADRQHFSLASDAGLPVLQAELQITNGSQFPSSPSAALLQSDYWNIAPAFTDSALGDSTVATTRLQIVPRAGAASFQLTLNGANLAGMVFAVGELFAAPVGGTAGLTISADLAGGGTVALDFLGAHVWDDGIRFFQEPVTWNGSTLSPAPGAAGESAFGFFSIPASAGTVTRLSFRVPSAANTGSGDAIQFAIGKPVTAVPEPGTALFGGLLSAFAALSRTPRRKSAPPHFPTA